MEGASVGPVAVVGGGVIGMAVALELATRSAECIVVDPAPGRGASWAAAGMLSPVAEVAPGEEPLLGELLAAASMWPAFAERVEAASGIRIGFERSSSILVGASPSDAREVARAAAVMRGAGASVEGLGAEELHGLEPALASGLPGGWLLPDDHRVDNRQLVDALREGLKALGVRIIEDECTRLASSASALRLELAHHGSLDVGRCVLATGASTHVRGAERLGVPAVRPVRGTTLRLGAVRGVSIPSRTIRGVVDAVHCYLVPRGDGSLVVGATSEEQGFEVVTLAGGVHRLLDAARMVLPAVDELVFEEAAAGLRPATADHLPFVARLGDPRVVAAIGHYRNGILLSPLAGRRAADLVLGVE